MKNLFLVFWGLLPLSLYGQQGFEYSFLDSAMLLTVHGGAELANGDFVISNHRTDSSWNDSSVFLNLIDNKGNLLDRKEVLNNYHLADAGIHVVNDSSFIVMGLAKVGGGNRIWLGTFSNDLSQMTSSLYGSEVDDYHLLVTHLESDSTILLTGWAGSPSNPIAYAGRIDFVNDTSYIHLSDEQNYTTGAFDIIQRKDSAGYLLMGSYDYFLTNDSFKIQKVVDKTNTGELPYPSEHGSFYNFTDSTYLITSRVSYNLTWPPTPDTSAILIGEVRASDLNLLRFELLGTVFVPVGAESVQSYPASVSSIVKSKQSTDIYTGGTYDLDVYLQFDRPSKFVLAKFDNELNLVWEKQYGEDSIYYQMNGLLSTSDGGCLMYGFRVQYTKGYPEELYILKVDENGVITGETIIPTYENLLVYPNPAKDFIQFDLPNITQKVSLELIDLSGRVVLAQKINHLEQIDISFLPKAMYGYRVMNRYGELVGMGKLVVE